MHLKISPIVYSTLMFICLAQSLIAFETILLVETGVLGNQEQYMRYKTILLAKKVLEIQSLGPPKQLCYPLRTLLPWPDHKAPELLLHFSMKMALKPHGPQRIRWTPWRRSCFIESTTQIWKYNTNLFNILYHHYIKHRIKMSDTLQGRHFASSVGKLGLQKWPLLMFWSIHQNIVYGMTMRLHVDVLNQMYNMQA